MSKNSADTKTAKDNISIVSPVATAAPVSALPARGVGMMSALLNSLTGDSTSNSTVESTTQTAKPNVPSFTFTTLTSSSPDISADSSPRAQHESKPNEKTQDNTPLAAATGAAVAVGTNINSSSPFEIVTHSTAQSPETSALHQAPPIIDSGESSPLVLAKPNQSTPKTMTGVQLFNTVVSSAPNSGPSTPDLTSSPVLLSVPSITRLTASDQKGKAEEQRILKSQEEIQSLKFQADNLKIQQSSDQKLIESLRAEIAQLTKENKRILDEQIAAANPLSARVLTGNDNKFTEENFAVLHRAHKALEAQHRNAQLELTTTQTMLSRARQEAEDRFNQGHRQGLTDKTLELAPLVRETERSRLAAVQEARAAQAAAASAQAHAAQQAAASQQAIANAAAAAHKRQNSMTGQ